jgi:hypothetical protein
MKKCATCGEFKDESEYNWRNKLREKNGEPVAYAKKRKKKYGMRIIKARQVILLIPWVAFNI